MTADSSVTESGVDIAALLARSHHDHAFVRRLLAPFVQGGRRAASPILAALADGNAGKASMAAHMLAGTLDRIGASLGAERARAFRTAIDTGDVASLSASVTALVTELDVVGRDVRAGLESSGVGGPHR